MSKCQRYYEIISAFVDSQANALEQLALQEHLKSCNICKNELASQYALKDMMSSCKSAADIDISSNVMRHIRYMKREEYDMMRVANYSSKHSHRWIAMGVMFALTTAALFLGNGGNSGSNVYANQPDPAKAYANYIYQHVNDEDSYAINYQDSNSSYKQVSFIK